MANGRLEVVSIPVSDTDLAKGFYVDKLGFRLIVDNEFEPGKRWLSVSVGEEAETVISLVAWDAKMVPGSAQGLIWKVDDLDTERERLNEAGVVVEEAFDTQWGRFAHFQDPDGNGWSLREGNRS